MPPSINYFDADALREDLKGRTKRGGAVTGVAQALRITIGLAHLPLLTRLLDPADFGLVAMVLVVTGFASMFVDAGLSVATIQRSEVNHRQVSNLFWIATGLGCVIAVIVGLLSPAIAWFYSEPRLIPITLAMTVSFVLGGLTVQHQALLRRGMQFTALAVADVVSQIAGVVVAVAWAWMYQGQPNDYWALVLMPLVTALVRLLLTCAACRWRPGVPKRGVGTMELMWVGLNLSGAQFVNYLARNADKAMIGSYWGEAPLGFYNNANRLLLFPLQSINTPITSVAVPTLSRLWDDKPRYRDYYRTGVLLTSAVLLPIVGLSVVLAEPIVLAVLGPQWGESAKIFLAFAPAAFMATTAPATQWVWLSSGRTDKLLKIVSLLVPIRMLAFAVALPYGPVAMAWSFSITVMLLRIPEIAYCFKGTGLSLMDQFGPMWRSAIACVVAMGAVLLLLHYDRLPEANFWRAAWGSVAFGLAYVVAWAALPGSIQELKRVSHLVRG